MLMTYLSDPANLTLNLAENYAIWITTNYLCQWFALAVGLNWQRFLGKSVSLWTLSKSGLLHPVLDTSEVTFASEGLKQQFLNRFGLGFNRLWIGVDPPPWKMSKKKVDFLDDPSSSRSWLACWPIGLLVRPPVTKLKLRQNWNCDQTHIATAPIVMKI